MTKCVWKGYHPCTCHGLILCRLWDNKHPSYLSNTRALGGCQTLRSCHLQFSERKQARENLSRYKAQITIKHWAQIDSACKAVNAQLSDRDSAASPHFGCHSMQQVSKAWCRSASLQCPQQLHSMSSQHTAKVLAERVPERFRILKCRTVWSHLEGVTVIIMLFGLSLPMLSLHGMGPGTATALRRWHTWGKSAKAHA